MQFAERERHQILIPHLPGCWVVLRLGDQPRAGVEAASDDVPPRRFAHPAGEHLIVASAEQGGSATPDG
jgi:hypothetical protein